VLGGFGVTRAAPGGGEVFSRLGEMPFEVTDLRLEAVFRRHGLGGGGGRLSHGPFGILEFLPGTGGPLGCLLRQQLLFRYLSLLLPLLCRALRGGLSRRTRSTPVSG
jgi:hypothetical protein